MNISKEQISDTVIGIVSKSLACDAKDLSPETRLITDLGMDSLDFVDVIFTLEKEFNTKVRDGELNKLIRPDKAETAKMSLALNEDEIVKLESIIPALRQAVEQGPVLRQNLFQYITIETLVQLVTRKLSE
jgi:acyl carrier protein